MGVGFLLRLIPATSGSTRRSPTPLCSVLLERQIEDARRSTNPNSYVSWVFLFLSGKLVSLGFLAATRVGRFGLLLAGGMFISFVSSLQVGTLFGRLVFRGQSKGSQPIAGIPLNKLLRGHSKAQTPKREIIGAVGALEVELQRIVFGVLRFIAQKVGWPKLPKPTKGAPL